jgi:hypothetical protein
MPAGTSGWFDKEMIWFEPNDGSPGRPAVFFNAAIQFKLPLRQIAPWQRHRSE